MSRKLDRFQPPLEQDIVKVTAVSSTSATCVTGYRSEIRVYWTSGRPDPLPQVGETWFVEKYTLGGWRFLSKQETGNFSKTSFHITLDSRTCYGRERGIADDIAAAGFDGVYINVADDGVLAWNSEFADDFGLTTYGDHLTQLVARFRERKVTVTLVIGASLWSDVQDEVHNRYQQRWMAADGSLTPTPLLSFTDAKEAVVSLVGELYDRYGTDVRGICFSDLSMAGENADFCPSMQTLYERRYDDTCKGLQAWDGTDGWWRRRAQWEELRASVENMFLASLRGRVGQWPISALVPSQCCMDVPGRLGPLATGIGDSFPSFGWDRVGVPLSWVKGNDEGSAMRSFETAVACAKRLAGQAQPLPVVDLADFEEYATPLSILARYSMGEVLVDSYERWRLLPDNRVMSLSSAMGSYRVSHLPDVPEVGVVLSESSLSVAMYDETSMQDYRDGFDAVCSQVLDKLPHTLRVLFDKDIKDGVPHDLSSCVLYSVYNMDDEVAQNVCSSIEGGAVAVFAGRCGTYDGGTRTIRAESPFAPLFDQRFVTNRDYVRGLMISGAASGGGDSSYAFADGSIGSAPLYSGTIAMSYILGPGSEEEAVDAPLLVRGRSVMFAMDVADDPVLPVIVGELALYSVGRDA